MDDEQFYRLVDALGFSRRGYRKVRGGVKKRLARLMPDLGCRTVDELLVLLAADEEAGVRVRRAMTVSISRFFRDRRLWEILAAEVLPRLAAGRDGPLRAWSAGCACGEEAYSLRIAAARLAPPLAASLRMEVIGTDINPVYLERARRGVYTAGSLREVSAGLRRDCFDPVPEGGFLLRREFRRRTRWLQRDLFDAPPGRGFDLILVRNNLLTYYRPEVAAPALDRMVEALSPGGYLAAGSHEELPPPAAGLRPSGRPPCLYIKENRG
jgi:chemotaxis methyl-accepting protein methylase